MRPLTIRSQHYLVSATEELADGWYLAADCDLSAPVYTAGTFLKGYSLWGIIPALSMTFDVADDQVSNTVFMTDGLIVVAREASGAYTFDINTTAIKSKTTVTIE
jgi:hypothetical protein